MLSKLPTLVLVLTPIIAVAAGDTVKESFALQMLECAYKHKTFALGPGTASAVAQAEIEAQKYIAPATKATSAEFVKQRSSEVKSAAEDAVLKEFESLKSVAEIKERWANTLSKCDAALVASPQ